MAVEKEQYLCRSLLRKRRKGVWTTKEKAPPRMAITELASSKSSPTIDIAFSSSTENEEANLDFLWGLDWRTTGRMEFQATDRLIGTTTHPKFAEASSSGNL